MCKLSAFGAHTWLENHRFASASSFLAWLCHWCTPGLILIYPVSWWETFLSVLWGYGCAASCRCVLSFHALFVPLLCPVMFLSDVIVGCSTSLGWLLAIILSPACPQSWKRTRIQKNTKDQFEIDLIMLLTPFILICSLDHCWPSCESLSQQSSNHWRDKTEALLGPLRVTGWCRIMPLKNSTIKTNQTKIVKNWLKLHTSLSLGPLAKVETQNT